MGPWRRGRDSRLRMLDVIRPYVDDSFYREDCRARGIAGEWDDSASHYLDVGWKADADPSPAFSTAAYLSEYPDIAASGLNPLYHFVAYGSGEGRRPNSAGTPVVAPRRFSSEVDDLSAGTRSIDGIGGKTARRVRRGLTRKDRFGRVAEIPLTEPALIQDTEDRELLLDSAALVDDDFYRGFYADLHLDKGAAAEHFMTKGWQDGRDPNYWFDTSFYLHSNPDVAASGQNPFLHYLANGRFEGRLPRLQDFREREVLLAQRSIGHQAEDWRRADLPVFTSPNSDLSRFAKAVQSITSRRLHSRKSRGLVVQIVSDDPSRNVGGVQLCVQAELAQLRAQDYDVVTIRPFQPLPILAPPEAREVALEVHVNGKPMKPAVRSTELALLIQQVSDATAAPRVLASIHGLLGHSIEILGLQLGQLTMDPVLYWLHDYFLLCSSPQLAFDNMSACGAPPRDSAQCAICVHSSQRRTQEERTLAFVRAIDAQIISPSQVAADVFAQQATRAWPDLDVLPHGVLQAVGKRGRPTPEVRGRVLRIGFVGNDVVHKGSLVFRKLRRAVAADHNIKLVQFGRDSMNLPGVDFVRVSQSIGNLGCMRDALLRRGVDAVLVWPTWPETYSFVAHEALAAGCVIITHPDSGNVYPLARRMKRSIVYDDVDSLLEAALSGELSSAIQGAHAEESPVWRFEFTGLMPGFLARSSQ